MSEVDDTARLEWMVENAARTGDVAAFKEGLLYFGFVVECEDGRQSREVYTSARAAIDEAMSGNLTIGMDIDEGGEDDFPF